jgi:TetR/AcrR family transcriptional regulator
MSRAGLGYAALVALAGRERILVAAEDLVVEQGVSGLTARAVAAAAGVRPGLIHYYFESIDALKLEVLERAATTWRTRTDETLVAAKNLRDLWLRWRKSMLAADEHRAFKLYVEMAAFAATDDHFRRSTILSTYEHLHHMLGVLGAEVAAPVPSNGPNLDHDALNVLLTALATGLRFQRLFGVTDGHEQLASAVADWLERLESAETDSAIPAEVDGSGVALRRRSSRPEEHRAPAKRTAQKRP